LLKLLLRRENCYEVFWRCCWVLDICNPWSIACELWSLRFQKKLYISIVVSLFFVTLLPIILLWRHYIYKTWWGTYDYVFSFLLKTGCDIMSSQYSFSNIAFDVFLFITKQSYIIEEMVKTKLWTKLLDVSIRIHTQTIQFVLVI